MVKIRDLNLMASGDACKFLGIKRVRLGALVKKYKIPYKMTSSGRIFLKEDIEDFQEARKEILKIWRKQG